MKCVWTQKVSLLIDGELAAAEAREAERHLEFCDDCQAAREDFLLLRRQLAAYPLELDAFARQRALKRILATAAAGGATGSENETAAAPSRRHAHAGVFGMPRLNPAALAALLLLLVGVAAGVVSLMNSRRAAVEVVSNTPAHAPVADGRGNSNDASSDATPNTPPAVPDDLTASTNKSGDEKAAANNRGRSGLELAEDGGRRAATSGVRAGATNMRRVESAGGRIEKSATPASFKRPRVDAPVAEVAKKDTEPIESRAGVSDTRGGDAATHRDAEEARTASAAGESKTARHVEQAQLLLRSFRNARPTEAGRRASSDLAYEKQRSQKLLYENIVLRREAASRGNLPVESLLDSLEPILIDIANLPDRPAPADVREINERMRRKNLVAMLQISAVESASARSY